MPELTASSVFSHQHFGTVFSSRSERLARKSMISVVIAVYNGAKSLTAALNSVMRQTCAPGEVIVVDDGSTDESPDIAASFGPPITVLRCAHRGGASALNAGVAEARGELLAFIDSDDLWGSGKLAQQSAVLVSDLSIDAVFGRVVQFSDIDCRIAEPDEIKQKSNCFVGINKTSMLIRRAAFDRVGPFNAAVVADFPEWYARALCSRIRIECLESVVAFRRIHRSNMTRLQREAIECDYLRFVRILVSQKEVCQRG
jgi:glycosyltransferase involved in cell wall biosynthesis